MLLDPRADPTRIVNFAWFAIPTVWISAGRLVRSASSNAGDLAGQPAGSSSEACSESLLL